VSGHGCKQRPCPSDEVLAKPDLMRYAKLYIWKICRLLLIHYHPSSGPVGFTICQFACRKSYGYHSTDLRVHLGLFFLGAGDHDLHDLCGRLCKIVFEPLGVPLNACDCESDRIAVDRVPEPDTVANHLAETPAERRESQRSSHMLEVQHASWCNTASKKTHLGIMGLVRFEVDRVQWQDLRKVGSE
jgi:hypothetical protein